MAMIHIENDRAARQRPSDPFVRRVRFPDAQRGDDLAILHTGTEMILRNFDKADLTSADFTV